jgi:hypothetical protein
MAPPHATSTPRNASTGARPLLAGEEGLTVPETGAVGPADVTPGIGRALSDPETAGVGAGIGRALSDPETAGIGAVGLADALRVPVGGSDGCWAGGAGGATLAGVTVIVSRTGFCPGTSTHVPSTVPTGVVPLLVTGVIRTVRLRKEIVAVPARVKTNEGVVPAAPTVIGPYAGTLASETVTGMVMSVVPCGAVTTPTASAVPLTLVAPIRWSASVTVGSTVADKSKMMRGTGSPTTTESGAFPSIRAVIAVLPYEGDEHVNCN